jgi:hypothetical protein
MNPRPNLILNPNKKALSKSIALTITKLGKTSKLSPKDKEPFKYLKNVCDFFTAKDKRTWNVSLMLSSAIVAARFERHSKKNTAELDGFQAKLSGTDLHTFKYLINPAAKHGFDYRYGGPKEFRQGLQSEFLHDEYAGTCPNPIATYTKEGVDSLLVKFIMPKARKNVKGYTHRGHIVRVDYKNKHNLHMLYHKLVKAKLSNHPEAIKTLDDFEEQYLNVRADEGLIKVVSLIYTQFEYEHNRNIEPKSVLVTNPARRNIDHVRIPIEERKGIHGSLPKDLAEVYFKDACRMFDNRLSIGVVTGVDGKEYLGYKVDIPVEDTTPEPKSPVETLNKVPTQSVNIEYIDELEEKVVSLVDGLRTSVKKIKKEIEKATESNNFGKISRLSLEAQGLQADEAKLLRVKVELYERIARAKHDIERANKG